MSRRFGRTQKMLADACEAIVDGQDHVIITGYSNEFCDFHLKPRLAKMLGGRGFSCRIRRLGITAVKHKRIAVIQFCTRREAESLGFNEGRSPTAYFHDHH